MMDANFGLTALLVLGNGGIAVKRFELSPNGLEYAEMNKANVGKSVYCQGLNLTKG